MKLQDAYTAEANKVGTWALIGYTAPGATVTGKKGSTTNFTYSPAAEGADEDAAIGAATGSFTETVVWEAASLAALNECLKGTAWQLKAALASSNNVVTYTALISDADNCEALTPSFGKISTNGELGK